MGRMKIVLTEDIENLGRVGEIVAVVGADKIPARMLEKAIRSNPKSDKSELLDELIVGSVLYEEAEAGGFAAGPEMKVLRKQLMVQRMLEDQVEIPAAPEDISEEKVRAYFDANRYLYEAPDAHGAPTNKGR